MDGGGCSAGAVVLAALALAAGPALAEDEGPGLDWRAPVSVDTGGGHRGSWRMNDSDYRFVDDPTVALLPGGEAALAWVDHTRQDVLFQRFGPDGAPRFDAPVDVSASPEIFSWLPRLAVAPASGGETVYALWQEIVFSGGSHGGEIFFARSTDGGASFGEPINLSRTEAGAGKGRLTRRYWHNGSLDLAVAPDGTVYAAWTEYEGPLRLARSTDSGRSFSEPLRVAGGPDALPARGPTLAAGADGVVHLAWTVGEDAAADIRYAASDDGGRTFADPRRIGASEAHADAPKLALDAEGALHLAYADSPDGPLERYIVRYTRRAPDAEGFAPVRTISSPLPEGYEGASFPHLAAAGGGRLYVAFELFRASARERPAALAVTCSADGGQSFAAPAVVAGTAEPGVNGSQQGLLMRKLAAGPGGTVAVVNSKFREGDSSRVRLYRGAMPEAGC